MTAAIGHNQPPSALELASSSIEDLRRFLKDNPVIGNEDEARAAKLIFDRVAIALKGIEDERKSKVDPLNLQVRAINTEYHRWHNSGGKPGLWDMLLKTLKDRMTAFARAEEAKRQAAPFSKGPPKRQPKKPGRKRGAAHGRHGHRPPPAPGRVDEVKRSFEPRRPSDLNLARRRELEK